MPANQMMILSRTWMKHTMKYAFRNIDGFTIYGDNMRHESL